MKTRFSRKNFTLLTMGVTFIVLFFLLMVYGAPLSAWPVTHLTENWRVTTPEGTTENTRLSDAHLGLVRQGDEFVFETLLPDNAVPAAAIQLKSNHASLQVLVDGEAIYEDGGQYANPIHMTPSRMHHIKLPADYAGKTLTIRMIANEGDAFTMMEPVRVGNVHDLFVGYLMNTRLTVVVGLYLAVMGVLLFLVFFYLNRYYGFEARLLSSALISLLLGIYLISYYKLTGFLTDNYISNDMAEYTALFFLPFAFVVFLASTQEEGRGKIFYVLAAIDYVIAAVLLILYALGLIRLNRSVPLIHAMILIEGVLLIAITLFRYVRARRDTSKKKEWKISEKIWLIGFFVMLFSAMLDVVWYNVVHYSGMGDDTFPGLNFLTIGAFVFNATLIVNFFYYHVEKIYASDVMNRLSGLAYTDPLTDMANRNKCEQTLEEVEKEGKPFTIVSLDIDSLKAINDRYGHAAGDQYLADMAAVMNEAFKDADLIGRMGGVEFLEMLRGADTKKCEAMLREVEDVLVGINKEKHPMHYGISYGYATSVETAYGTVEAVYHLADRRMYAMKQDRNRRGVAHA
ncbi:MAG: GGDEF domain-containing protein [Lachnospiraceae bacterium]|nr:GGDEF domain-containing protein [Lachnospiraceae bacterium]